jgi:hypothetical protein
MKKLLILCLTFIVFLASCGTGGQDKDVNSDVSNNNSAQTGTEDNSLSSGQLTVTTDITKVNASDKEVLPDEKTADLLNPEVIKNAGANNEALAMRKKVLESKDSISVSGTTYYVSPTGSDTNDGMSPKTPFETINVAFATAKEGDAVLLERGSVFRLNNTITLSDGVAYGAYGKGPKPEIWGSPENYADPIRWSPYTIRNVWAIDFYRSDVGMIVFNHGELAGDMQYYVRNLKKNGDFFFDDAQKVLYVYCDKGNPGSVYKDIEIGSRMIMFRLRDGAENVTIDNLSFKYTGTFGIRGSMGCRNINITNCVIGWVGGSLFQDGSNRYGNGIEFTSGCENLNVENCWIYQVYDAGFTFQITTADTTIEERTYKNISLKDTLIEYCSWAFEWWPSDVPNSIFENISITGNIMRFSGYGWAGDTRTPSHIRGPWSAKECIISNFMITKNIFDCSNGPVYAWTLFSPEQFENTFEGNEYYQKAPTSTRNVVFEIDYLGQGVGTYAVNSQKEFDNIVNKIDKKPTLVKWLS